MAKDKKNEEKVEKIVKGTKTTKKIETSKSTKNKTKTTKAKPKKDTATRVKKEVVIKTKPIKEEEVKETLISEKTNDNKKKFSLSSILVIAVIMLFIVTFVASISETREKSKYYVSISFDKFTELIKKKEPSIIYWAQPECGYCQQFKPTVMSVSYENKVKFNYLNTAELSSDEYAEVLTYLMKYSDSYKTNGPGTPALFVLQDGKITSVNVGLMEKDELVSYLKENGLIKGKDEKK